jgi:predicted exporter
MKKLKHYIDTILFSLSGSFFGFAILSLHPFDGKRLVICIMLGIIILLIAIIYELAQVKED